MKINIIEIDKFMYRDITVTITYSRTDKSFHASTKIGNVFDDYDTKRGNNTMGFETPVKAINAIERMIDDTIANIATNSYEELANKIASFTFDIDEGLDPYILKLILDNFKPQ